MFVELTIGGGTYRADLRKGHDLSLGIRQKGVKAWYVDEPEFVPEEGEGFVGSVARGGSVNFFKVGFHPHGHGTHTECIGHISKQRHSVNSWQKEYHMVAQLHSVQPAHREQDQIILKEHLSGVQWQHIDAAIIRTRPNGEEKQDRNYSSTNPPYFHPEALAFLREQGVRHLLTDLPSVDPEHDDGKLVAHRAFWNFDDEADHGNHHSITELIYANNGVADGLYYLNLQMAAFENDAAPSRPVIYPLKAL